MEIVLTLKSGDYPPNEPDAWQRLRKLLKALLRSYGLRCVDIRRNDELKSIGMLDTQGSGQNGGEAK